MARITEMRSRPLRLLLRFFPLSARSRLHCQERAARPAGEDQGNESNPNYGGYRRKDGRSFSHADSQTLQSKKQLSPCDASKTRAESFTGLSKNMDGANGKQSAVHCLIQNTLIHGYFEVFP